MSHPTNTWRKVMAQPGHFTLQVLKAFQKNQGLLLSGALAYYILLSVIPKSFDVELKAFAQLRRYLSTPDRLPPPQPVPYLFARILYFM
jgi:hypothetical protein